MREIGVVTKTEDKRITVKVNKKDECSKCGMCLFPKGADGVEFHAQNDLDANVGDIVEIELTSGGNLIGALLAFLVPLLLIGISAVVTYLVIKQEIYLLVLGLGSVILWYLILPLIDKKIGKGKRFTPKLINIIKKSQFENTQGEQNND